MKDILNKAIIRMAKGSIEPPAGTKLTKVYDGWELTIQDVFIVSYCVEDDSYMIIVNDNYMLVNRLVNQCPVFVELLRSILRESDEVIFMNNEENQNNERTNVFDCQNSGHRTALITLLTGQITGLLGIPAGIDFKRIGDTAEWYIDDICFSNYGQTDHHYTLTLVDDTKLNQVINRRPNLVKNITTIANRLTW